VTSPYDIEEIFPADAAGPVRLPRRQAGTSPQGLAVTLLADYTLRTRAGLPSAAIVALLAEAGVSAAGARTAISRLSRRGIVEGHRRGRHSSYRLTAAAAANLAAGGRAIVSPSPGTQPWDGRWTVIAFSLPQQEGARRRGLRNQLRWLGYAPLYDGLWISPRDLTDKARTELAGAAPGTMTVFRARHVELGAVTDRRPLEAWDTAAIARHYEDFIERWRPLPARLPAGAPGGTPGESPDGALTGAEAVRARTEIMDSYRRLPILDPHLPLELLPPGWLREPAREVFVAVYDGLAATAQNHVRDVAARCTGEPVSGIRAHTVSDLAGGLAVPAGRQVGQAGRVT